ncbi:PGAM [Musa troglodytarum]|uniref:PGAM n=1 Tax=Musa troglodytarum TaxID=320322 RepID=A0A9E7KBW9_9LILI|nr:PGAM [Musa troglodytarum]
MASTADRGRFAEIVVIRHGETCWNASRIVQGHLNSELNEIGRQQAIAVSYNLFLHWVISFLVLLILGCSVYYCKVAGRLSKEPKFQAIYSSDLKRAAETANIIAKICNLPEVILDPGLRERHLGDIQGLTLRDAAKLKPEAYKIFLSRKRDGEIPGGGESPDQVNERCVSCLEKIASKHQGERVIVLTHGGVLRELHKHAVSGRSSDGMIHNTAVNVFLISESGNWTIKTWGDISHLHEIGVLNNAFGGDRTSG